MKKFRGILVVAAMLSVVVFTGCEIDATNSSSPTADGNPLVGDTSATPASQAAPLATNDASNVTDGGSETNGQTSLDDLDISNAKDYGPHAGKSARHASVTRKLHSASIRGSNVSLSFDELNWSSRGGGGKTIDGGVYIYWVDGGSVIGGLFDWHGRGQTAKTLANIKGGYLSGHQPPKGATVYFVLVDLGVNQRTNVKRCSTPW